VRVLVVSNMLPDSSHPERGRFVRDQVTALRQLDGLEVQLHEFPPGGEALARATSELRRRFAGQRFDVAHAHFSLSALPALAVSSSARGLTLHGTDVRHRRTRLLTRAILPRIDLVGAVSASLVAQIPGASARGRALILPCGVDRSRFHPIPRPEARSLLGLEVDQPYLLFAADPHRAGKRVDRARRLADALGVALLTLGSVEPEQVPLWHNAANAVLVPSDHEGFGLAVLEALACDVPVLATPVGIHRDVLEGLDGTLCAPFEVGSWQALAEVHLSRPDPRVDGRSRTGPYSAVACARKVADAWSALLERLA
jgi:teichuronic acid biosynthesis glycosyltransferase TuaC